MSGLTEIRDEESDPHLERFLVVFIQRALLIISLVMGSLGSFSIPTWTLVAVV